MQDSSLNSTTEKQNYTNELQIMGEAINELIEENIKEKSGIFGFDFKSDQPKPVSNSCSVFDWEPKENKWIGKRRRTEDLIRPVISKTESNMSDKLNFKTQICHSEDLRNLVENIKIKEEKLPPHNYNSSLKKSYGDFSATNHFKINIDLNKSEDKEIMKKILENKKNKRSSNTIKIPDGYF